MATSLKKQTASQQVLKKNVSVIHINAKLSLVQRKLVNALVYNAYESLMTADSHSINVRLLSEMIGFDSHNVSYLKQALKGMVETSVEWDVLEDDGSSSWEVSALLSFAKIQGGTCTYRYDKSLAEKLFHPDIYSKINLSVVKNMKSSYSLILYENCYRFLDIGKTGWWDLDTFRKIMGLENNDTYLQFKFLNRDIIKPALREVNKLSNILLEFETKRSGRTVTGIRFLMKPNPQLSLIGIDEDDEITHSKAYKALVNEKVSKTLARAWVLEYGEEYVLDKLLYANKQASLGKIKSSKTGFLKSAIENDYASDEAAEKERKKTVDELRAKKRDLELKIEARKSQWLGLERQYRKERLNAIWEAYKALSDEEQAVVKSEFAEKLPAIVRRDFNKREWDSMLAFQEARSFWEARGLPCPTFFEYAKDNGIDDPEAFQKATSQLEAKLQNT